MAQMVFRVFCLMMVMMVASVVAPAHAGFMAEEIEDGIYFVSYERGRWTAGSVLDTARKAQRKLSRKSHEFCLEQGYSHLQILSLAEISRDEELRAAWEIYVGDEAADSFQTSGGIDGYSKTHKSRRVLLLSESEMEGFDRCVAP